MSNIWAESRRPRDGQDVAQESVGAELDSRGMRSVFQQDYDRLLFSTPVRRLADKTQVWPMDENDGVRTRLTHSHEVANLARSIGTRAFNLVPGAFQSICLNETVQPILSAIGLAHDLGNPPFGHQGEAAISSWFKSRSGWIFTKTDADEKAVDLDVPVPPELHSEFTRFDGNPQTLRLLSRLQTHHARVGLDLTAATLAAVLKYPVHAGGVDPNKAQAHKAGYFESEREVVDWIREETGLREGQRHPLTWIMEACDDIAYSVLDVDDLLKKKILSPDDALVILKHNESVGEHVAVQKLEAKFREVNNSDRHADIRYDIKVQYLRAYMVEALIGDASESFVQNVSSIMSLGHDTALMEGNPLSGALQDLAKQYGFRHPAVLKMEAMGAVAIDGLMSALWTAISDRKEEALRSKRASARASYVFALISPNYIEEAELAESLKGPASGVRYRELRLLTDMVSGMTDTFAMRLWREISAVPDVSSA